MAIQWFPGHMHKARKAVKEELRHIALVIEVLDARIPYSSSNPMIDQLCAGKPRLKVLTKGDLADPAVTAQWLAHFAAQPDTAAMQVSSQQADKLRREILQAIPALAGPAKAHRTLNVMIVGIPNVGKSTLINILANKAIAKTGNEPAITKGLQRIRLDQGIMLYDTPGMLWPKVENEHSGYRLATVGSIKDTAISHDEVAFFAAEYLLQAYPTLLAERYQLDPLPEDELGLLEQLGRVRGCLVSGGRVDLERAASLFLNELRAATIGRISLETPSMMAAEEIQVAEQRQRRAEQKKARDEARKQKPKRSR